MTALFKVFKIDAPEAARIQTAPNNPHKHDYEELIVGINGKIEHFIDFETITLNAPFVSFVTKGKVHKAVPLPDDQGQCDMWVIRFKSEFIPETTFQLYHYYHNFANIQMSEGKCFERMSILCQLIAGEASVENPDFSIIRHLLSALFTMIESERKKKGTPFLETQKTQKTTFQNFLKILEENYHRPLGVEFYAEKLFMSARNLNIICQHILQKSVSEIIETRKLIEAKNLLINTDKPISEIGYELGYNEKTYFTSLFKKKTGQTPKEFRAEMQQLIS